MSRVKEAFSKGKAFVPFITCGDPSIEVTEQIIIAMERAGADVIELGIPFSDPTAEGPVIQEANIRALKNQITTDDVFEMVKRVRGMVGIPLLFMTYANVVYSYGIQRFVEKCVQVGIDGMILPDVPYEEKAEFSEACYKEGIDFISMIAPTSKERIKKIAEAATGFLYCVSSLGVTGTRASITTNIDSMIQEARRVTDLPCAVGFGIQSEEQAKEMSKKADGIIVGSAIVSLCAQYKNDCVPYIEDYVKRMRQAINDK